MGSHVYKGAEELARRCLEEAARAAGEPYPTHPGVLLAAPDVPQEGKEVNAEGICPFAIWLPGPPEKTGYSDQQKTHAKVGAVIHCLEYESGPEWNDAITLGNALYSNREASWPFSIVKFLNEAALIQHYPLGTVTWHAGYQGNLWLEGIEVEARSPHKFTEPQFALLVKTLRWLQKAHKWQPHWIWAGREAALIPQLAPAFFEHNAVPGAPATNCAVFTNGQVDPQRLLAALKGEDMDEIAVRGIVDKALKPVERLLELQLEAQDIRAAVEFWLSGYGEPVEDKRFMAFVNAHIAWRLRGKPGWTVP